MSVYALSDLHGMSDLYKQIKNFLKPEDKVYFLGDAGDRGPRCMETIKLIARDPQFIYLKGNHEQMLVDALVDYLDGIGYTENQMLCFQNGGHPTYEEFILEHDEQILAGWVKYLHNLPEEEQYENEQGHLIVLTHSGYTFGIDDSDKIWNRSHISDAWPKAYSNVIMVHGHTPNPRLAQKVKQEYDEVGAVYYCGNHKIGIDAGAVWTDCALLLDLDTFDEHIFYSDKEMYN